jgi:hypothetical protein
MYLRIESRHHGCRIAEYQFKGHRLIVLENRVLRAAVLATKGADILELRYKPLDIDVLWHPPENINVFPNPYYALNASETNRFSRFVTFSHLPANCTIRIFNLAGHLVRSIVKDGASNPTQFVQWDLTNQYGFPVASGVYIAHIDLPDLGTTKVLKVAIIQEQEVLQYY